MLQIKLLRMLATVVLLVMVFHGSLNAQSSPMVISNYQTGTDNTLANVTEAGLASPSLIIYPKLAFRGGNNCAILAATSNSAYTQGTPTDNTGETWHAGPSVTDGAYTLKIWYVLGDTAGTDMITVPMSGTPTSSPESRLGATLTEVENCNTSSIGGTGTLDTTATGSTLTLTLSAAPSSGDMALAYFIDTAINVNTYATAPFDSSITAGSGFTFLSKSLSFGKAAEYNTSTTSTSVPIAYSGSDTIIGAALVIQEGPAGTGPPSGAYIDHYQVEQFTGNNQVPFPCSGNLILGLVSANAVYVTSVSGSTGTWVTPSSGLITANNDTAQIFYGYGASCASTTTVTPTWNATPGFPGTEIAFASVTNVLNTSSVFDGGHTTSGTQSTDANLTTDSITPAHVNDIIFNMTSIDTHSETGTVTDANGHTPTFLAAVNTKDDNTNTNCGTNTSMLDEDNGYGVFQNTDMTAVTFIYAGSQVTGTCNNNPAGVGNWSSATAAFATGQSVNPPNPPTNLTATPN